MVRFDDLDEWEISSLLSGIYALGPFLRDNPNRKLMEELRFILAKKSQERMDRLPKCECCKQVLKNG